MKKILLFGLLLVCCFASFAQPGVLDQMFGNNGKVILPLDTIPTHTPLPMALQPDGKIVTGTQYGISSIMISRFNADGSPDLSFGNAGKVINPYWMWYNYTVNSIAVQPDGKIVAAGSDNSGSITMVRLNANGTKDSTFDGDGQLSTPYLIFPISAVYKVLVRPGGKIVTVGTVNKNSDTYYQLMQFMPNGRMDSSFAVNGIFEYKCGYLAAARDAIVLPSGKILIGGTINPNSSYGSITLMQLLPNGILDSAYGTNGLAFSNNYLFGGVGSTVIAMQSDGKAVAAGEYYHVGGGSYTKVEVARFTINGKPDSTFGYLGISSATFRHDSDYVSGIHVQADGKILVTGTTDLNAFSSLRMLPNGSLDSTYGKRGMVNVFMSDSASLSRSSCLQPDGKLLLLGYGQPAGSTNGYVKMSLARFEVTPYVRYNTFKGAVYLDKNANGTKDTSEPYFDYATIVCNKSLHPVFTQTSNGQFKTDDLDSGIYVCEAVPFKPYYAISPATHTVSNTGYFATDSAMFGLQPIAGKHDLSVHIVWYWIVRPGFPTHYTVQYKNEGTDTVVNGSVYFVKDSNLTYMSSTPAANSISGDTLTWTFSNLYPMQTGSFTVYFDAQAPPVLNIGDYVRNKASISALNDLNPTDNNSSLFQRVRGAYDPNDKTEVHGGEIALSKATAGEYLTYTIRFQNTGNDTALNVYIRDTMDSKLNWNTMQIIAASHNYQMTMNDDRCLFIFPNINLVDSIHNEPLSHGYLTYVVKAKPNVQVGNVIKNTAAIYFDYNLPVITNTETTTVVADAQPLKLLAFTAKKDGKTNLLNWTSANEVNVDRFEVERSGNPNSAVGTSTRDFGMIGKVKAGLSNYSFTDNNPLKATNYYRLKMIDKDGQFTYSPVRMLNNSGTFAVSIYPNPAKDNLQIQIDSDKKTAMKLQVLSMDGKVILSSNTTATAGSVLRSINIGSLPKGSYFLKATIADKDEQVVKFEKL